MTREQRTTPPFRLVLVGCGRFCWYEFEAIDAKPDLELVAVCDEMPERAREAGE